jgi:hypothetical protein
MLKEAMTDEAVDEPAVSLSGEPARKAPDPAGGTVTGDVGDDLPGDVGDDLPGDAADAAPGDAVDGLVSAGAEGLPGDVGYGDDLDPARCIVIVPVRTHVEEECAVGLAELQARGYMVRQVIGQTAIDYARSKMATDALEAGFEEIMWIDSDVGFTADDVEVLRRHRLPMVSGIYPQKGHRALASHLLPETEHLVFGIGGGLIEILYAAGGFLLTHRRVYEAIREHEQLPYCNERFGGAFTPYFWPMVVPDEDGHWYLAEDFAFCERARRAGFAVMADTRIRLQHIGRIAYSWEDAGSDRPRYASYGFSVTR